MMPSSTISSAAEDSDATMKKAKKRKKKKVTEDEEIATQQEGIIESEDEPPQIITDEEAPMSRSEHITLPPDDNTPFGEVESDNAATDTRLLFDEPFDLDQYGISKPPGFEAGDGVADIEESDEDLLAEFGIKFNATSLNNTDESDAGKDGRDEVPTEQQTQYYAAGSGIALAKKLRQDESAVIGITIP
jgi:hypothetical protein